MPTRILLVLFSLFGWCCVCVVSVRRELITNGVPVASDQTYPYFTFQKFGRGAGCGATLIHTDILLTAAHCRQVFRGRGAYVGATTNFGFDDGEFHEDETVLQHPLYRAAEYSNDIMLVKLETGSQISPVRFNQQQPWQPVVGSNLTVMGFGDTSFQGELSENLLETHVIVSDFEECAALYWNQSEAVLNETTQFCALGEEGRDACQADSGGPMIVVNVNGEAEQVGVVSFGLECGQENVPAVYVRVGAFADWIQAGICQLSSSPPARCHDDNHNTQQGGNADDITVEELAGGFVSEEQISSSGRDSCLLVVFASLLVSVSFSH